MSSELLNELVHEYSSLKIRFRVVRNTITSIEFVPEVAEAIITVYFDEAMKLPDCLEDWKEIANGFSKRLNFHNTL